MPAPATADEFLDLIRKSGVVDEGRLGAYVKQLQSNSNVPTDMSKYAGLFVRDGLLTFFQAEQFLLGKWKRFTIGKYKVLERLGSGGMGQVFLCEHKLMRRKVAVKVLPTAKAEDPSSLDRFYREARAVAALDHPNIVRAYDIDQDDNLHFLVMEYVDGASLQDVIKKHGRMDVVRACHYMYWSAIGLQHAHEAGLIHRDIKPGNILIDRLGTVKILDMGLARFFNDDEDNLTKKYDENVLGTADYLAPEQALDSHSVDGRADIYSLGATFYFLLAGAQPFVEGTVAQKLIWHQTRNPKSLRDIRPEVPEGVVAIVEKMMAKDPANRYQSPAELAEALAPWVQTPIGPPPEKEMPTLSAAAQAIGGGSPTTTNVRQVPQTPRANGGSETKQSASAGPVSPSPSPAPKPPGGISEPAGGGSGKRGSKLSIPAARNGPTPACDNSDTEATARRNNLAPIVESLPSDSEPAVWESLSQDTNNVARDNTDRQPGPSKSKPKIKPARPSKEIIEPEPEEERALPVKRPRPSRGQKKSPLRIIIPVLSVVALLAAIAVWRLVLRAPQPRIEQNDTPASGPLTVSKEGGAGQFRTVRDALNKARDGSRIVILDSPWEEALILASGEGRGVTIEGAENKEIVWKVPSNSKQILSLSNPDRLKIRNLHFDGTIGKGQTERAIQVTGKVAGLLLEDLVIRNVSEAGILFNDSMGAEKDPAIVQRVRIISKAQCGIYFSAPFKAGSPARNEWISVQDCALAGPFGGGAFQIDGNIDHVDLRRNRVWNANDGIYLKEARKDNVFRVIVKNNTFHTVVNVLRFQKIGALASQPGNVNIELENNFFMGAGSVLKTDDGFVIPGGSMVRFVDNARSPDMKEGNPSSNSVQISPQPQLPTNPEDDSQFLRYPRTSNLMAVGPLKSKMGVPPAN